MRHGERLLAVEQLAELLLRLVVVVFVADAAVVVDGDTASMDNEMSVASSLCADDGGCDEEQKVDADVCG